jgi:hypothetical protein
MINADRNLTNSLAAEPQGSTPLIPKPAIGHDPEPHAPPPPPPSETTSLKIHLNVILSGPDQLLQSQQKKVHSTCRQMAVNSGTVGSSSPQTVSSAAILFHPTCHCHYIRGTTYNFRRIVQHETPSEMGR